jgi:hypothetical protein
VPGTKCRIFSRDCLELAIDRDEDTRIHVLCNHFKSQMGAAVNRLRNGWSKPVRWR